MELPVSNHTTTSHYSATGLGKAFIGAYFIFAAVSGVVLNLISVAAIRYGRSIKNELKFQLIHSSTADLVFSIFYSTLNYLIFMKISVLPNLFLCGTFRFIAISVLHATMWCIAAISLQVFVMCYCPYRSPRFTTRYKVLTVTLIWLLAAGPEILNSVGLRFVYMDGMRFCEGVLFSNTNNLYGWLQTAKNLIPSAIVIVVYASVLIKFYKAKQISNTKDDRRIKKLSLMLGIDAVMTALVVGANSYHYMVPQLYSFTLTEEFKIDVIFGAIANSKAFLTPIVYMISNKSFRDDVKMVLERGLCCSGITQMTEEDESDEEPFIKEPDHSTELGTI
ncbi:rhodopsin-like [Watersipora subatra]|uniref:rhodopsin-like n=1 Tax=Watersipora subatra TaxID=2589382 RepID=UPI00355C2302